MSVASTVYENGGAKSAAWLDVVYHCMDGHVECCLAMHVVYHCMNGEDLGEDGLLLVALEITVVGRSSEEATDGIEDFHGDGIEDGPGPGIEDGGEGEVAEAVV